MKCDVKRLRKQPSGLCKQIAEICGTTRHYVSQVLAAPDQYNGFTAARIKDAHQRLIENNQALKEYLATPAEFNPLDHEQSK